MDTKRANRKLDGVAVRLTVWIVLSIVHFATTFGAGLASVLLGLKDGGNHQLDGLMTFLAFPANLLPPLVSTWLGKELDLAFVAVNSAAAMLSLMLGIEAVYRGCRAIASTFRSRQVSRGFEVIPRRRW